MTEQDQIDSQEATVGSLKGTPEECKRSGGTCEFFVTCWLGGGLLDGGCGILLSGCCYRNVKRQRGTKEAPYDVSNFVEYNVPTVNDKSESKLHASSISSICLFLFFYGLKFYYCREAGDGGSGKGE